MKRPDYYKTPLRKRGDIASWIWSNTAHRSYRHTSYPFCFDVKAHSVDLDFDTLLDAHRQSEGDAIHTHNSDWLLAVRELYDEHEENLFEWGLEGARRHFVSDQKRDDGKPDGDAFRMLWDGTMLDVRYDFVGRSGGWLSLSEFEGHDFTRRGVDWEAYMRGKPDADPDDISDEPMPYADLRKLYQLIVMLKHDTCEEAIVSEVAHNAAFDFFVNICREVPQPDAIQPVLFPELEGTPTPYGAPEDKT
jgi:hypothetical protein